MDKDLCEKIMLEDQIIHKDTLLKAVGETLQELYDKNATLEKRLSLCKEQLQAYCKDNDALHTQLMNAENELRSIKAEKKF